MLVRNIIFKNARPNF